MCANQAFPDGLAALADPTRRRIFERLLSGPQPVQRLATGLPVSRPAVSQHLRVLVTAGLVSVRAEGTRRIYAVNPDGVAVLRATVDGFWGRALAQFQAAATAAAASGRQDKE